MKTKVNKTELRLIVKEYEEVDIRRSVNERELISIIDEETEISERHICPLIPLKEAMEEFIMENMTSIRTQLPGCNGHCTTFGCPDGVVVNCHLQMKNLL